MISPLVGDLHNGVASTLKREFRFVMQGRSALTCLVSSSQHICYAKVFPGIMKDNDLKITTCDGVSCPSPHLPEQENYHGPSQSLEKPGDLQADYVGESGQ